MTLLAAATARADDTFPLFERVRLGFDEQHTSPVIAGPNVFKEHGQVVETTLTLPELPEYQREALRIIATIEVWPELVEIEDGEGPADPWPRLGSVSVMLPRAGAGEPQEVELVRFITAYGGHTLYTQDITPLAPVIGGEHTFRLTIDTVVKPAWKADVYLTYSVEGVGQRRPIFAAPLFFEPEVKAESNALSSRVRIPVGLATPRLRIITTGHAIDGSAGDEFLSRTHILRIDDKEVARWRPWREEGGGLRDDNPTSGRRRIDGRNLWSSDLDRAGWHPGLTVRPLIIPCPELVAGPHHIELRIIGIRRAGTPDGPYGYWRVSGTVVADQLWPTE